MKLPREMLELADTSSNEEAWRPNDFPGILKIATTHRLVCIGGQFQFRGPIGTAEMYWIEANSSERRTEESWDDYVARANAEVEEIFTKKMRQTDFSSEALQWDHIRKALKNGLIRNPEDHLVFVAYFDREHGRSNK